MRSVSLAVRTGSPDDTVAFGRRLAAIVQPGEILLLVGDLGTGKTTFVQGLAEGLGIADRPHSPTFALVHQYDGDRPLVHVDLYRTSSVGEVADLGLEDLFVPPAVAAVEWGERAAGVVGPDYLELRFTWDDDETDVRTIELVPVGRWTARVEELNKVIEP